MTFFVLDANPVKSANRLCWLDCESATYEGARILISAFNHHGADTSDIDFEPKDEHPLVRFALVNADTARWLFRYTRAATIKWGKDHDMEDYARIMKELNKVAGLIDEALPRGQQTLFGNFYIDGKVETIFKQASIESNISYYEKTREHLRWADDEPSKYGRGEEE